MNDRDIDQLLNAWMDLGPTTAPDRVAEAARLEARTTPQTAARGWWPARRLPEMSTFARIGLAAAAVAVVAAIGMTLLGRPGNVGVSDPTVAPTPGPSLVSHVSSTAFPMRITVGLPAGWQSFGDSTGEWVWKRNGLSRTEVGFYVVDNLYMDPCQPELGWRDPAIGGTADDLVAELLSLPPYRESTPTEVLLGGHRATHITTPAATAPNACADAVNGSQRDAVVGGIMLGQYRNVWIVDVDGERLMVVTQNLAGEGGAVLASIQIEP